MAQIASRSPYELVLTGDPGEPRFQEFLDVVRHDEGFVGTLVGIRSDEEHVLDAPIFQGRVANPNRPTAYLCHSYICDLPTESPAELEEQLKRLRPATGQ